MKRRSHIQYFSIALAAAACASQTACFVNSRTTKISATNKLNLTDAATSSSSSGGDSYSISSVTIAASTNSSSSSFTTSVFFDVTKSPSPISNHCNVATSSTQTSKPCVCEFSWQEINDNSGSSVSISRSVTTNVSAAQPNMITCPAPQVYGSEIINGTTIKVKVMPGPGNSDQFSMQTYKYTKSASAVTGSFQDAQGQFFDNVLHYSCYEQFKRGMTLSSKIGTANNPSTGDPVSFPMASQFCVGKSGSSVATPGCSTVTDNSAQSYYYNLYIRDSEQGDINQGNSRYICPKVLETLPALNTGSVGSKGQYWPLDATFALSLGQTGDFSVGVEAFSKASNGTDPTSTDSQGCNATSTSGSSGSSGSGSNNTLVKSCLGFAAKPNTDGTCPSFQDSTGSIRLTYRLRRFVALYPQVFDTDGAPMKQSQAVDTIYVLDRPVNSPNADPLKPYTMRGPKPCPFAFFDSKGVTGSTPGYAATNDSAWTGKSVDGIQFPNVDSPTSCAAAMPLYDPVTNVISIGTVHSTNPNSKLKQIYVRPIQAWAPHYEEDTDFQACAPQASPMRDAPLHFSKNTSTGNVSWCAESYPSQNDNIASLDTRNNVTVPYTGKVAPFTSHVSKNSTSAECTKTLPTNISTSTSVYPAASTAACPSAGPVPSVTNPQGYAWHPTDLLIDKKLNSSGAQTGYYCAHQTCDRTVLNPGSGLTWPRFPLLASAGNVESAIAADSTYGCTVSWDNGGNKSGKTTPSNGCCGASVWVNTGSGGTSSAHLEPDVTCQVPDY